MQLYRISYVVGNHEHSWDTVGPEAEARYVGV